MEKRVSYIVVYTIILILILILIGSTVVYGDDSYDSNGGWGTTESTGYSEGEDGSFDESGGGYGSEDADTIYTADAPGYSLFFGLELWCHVNGRVVRDNENMFVVGDNWEKYGHLFEGDYDPYDSEGDIVDSLANFFPYDPNYEEVSTSFFDIDEEGYYYWDYYSTEISISTRSESDNAFDNAKLHRFEGIPEEATNYGVYGCIPFFGTLAVMDFTDTGALGPVAFNGKGEQLDPIIDESGQTTFSKVGYYDDSVSGASNYGLSIEWDDNEDDCTAIGGTWYSDYSGENYACCGDDRTWLYNRAVNGDDGFDNPTVSDDDIEDIENGAGSSFCLYGAGDLGIDTEAFTAALDQLDTAGHYLCPAPIDHSDSDFSAYDDALDNDDDYEAAEITKETPYFFKGIDDTETDIGKWSDGSESNPQFCYYNYDDEVGEQYQWLDVNVAGDMPVDDEGNEITDFNEETERQSTLCEAYLGGTWTGSVCCGNKYDYESTGSLGTNWWDDDNEEEYFAESYSEESPIYYDDGVNIEYGFACLQGEAYNDGAGMGGVPVSYIEEDGTVVAELLNSEGKWYGCNLDTTTIDRVGEDIYTDDYLITTERNIDTCDTVESYLCNYNPETESWEWYSTITGTDEGNYVRDTLGYSSGETFTLSEPVWATEEEQQYACCAGNTCWDGAQCVDQYTEYTYDENGDGEDEYYVCYQGSWSEPLETKYDWYHNTDATAIDHCIYEYSCVCSSNNDDDTFCTDNDAYLESGCTTEMDFYSVDHLCEATNPTDTDGDGVLDTAEASQWTSRTKILAFHLMQFAEGTEYTLYCDSYNNALNNYVDVEAIAESINSFCILQQGEEVTIGVTFNSEDAAEPMLVDAEEILFEGSNAFVELIDSDVDDCSYAFEEPSAYRFGEFYSCDASTDNVFYNNVIHGLIFSKDGFGSASSLSLSEANQATYQDLFDGYKTQITNYLTDTSTTVTTPDGSDDLKDEFEGFASVSDYNKIYYKNEAATTIFGFEETKYAEDKSANRAYLSVLYTGVVLDCDQIYTPYESTANIFCTADSTSSTGMVLERSTSGSEYWRSLTSGFREE